MEEEEDLANNNDPNNNAFDVDEIPIPDQNVLGVPNNRAPSIEELDLDEIEVMDNKPSPDLEEDADLIHKVMPKKSKEEIWERLEAHRGNPSRVQVRIITFFRVFDPRARPQPGQ